MHGHGLKDIGHDLRQRSLIERGILLLQKGETGNNQKEKEGKNMEEKEKSKAEVFDEILTQYSCPWGFLLSRFKGELLGSSEASPVTGSALCVRA